MPFITIRTNAVSKDAYLADDVAKMVAELLHKPLVYVVVQVSDACKMSFDGRFENKGALIEAKSIGFADKALLAQKLTDLVVERLDVEKRLVNIEFVNMVASDVAIAGTLLG